MLLSEFPSTKLVFMGQNDYETSLIPLTHLTTISRFLILEQTDRLVLRHLDLFISSDDGFPWHQNVEKYHLITILM